MARHASSAPRSSWRSWLSRSRPQAAMDLSTQSVTEMFLRRQLPDLYLPRDPNAHAAVFACRDLIGRLVSTLPVAEYERDADGRLTRVPDQPSLLEEPEADTEIADWLYGQVSGGLLGPGMAFGLVTRTEATAAGRAAREVVALPPEVVELKPRNSVLEPARWTVEGREVPTWPLGPLWIARGYPIPGSPVGLSPLGLARRTVNIGLGARQFAFEFFRDGRIPAGVIVHPDPQEKETRTAVQRAWVDETRDAREPRVLTGGWTFVPQRVMAEESQFLSTINANAADVARFFGVAPEDIGSSSGGASVTYANVEQRQIQLLVRTIGPWVVRLERRLSRLRPPGREIRFSLDGLLRTDARTRSQIINDQIRAGRLSVNEARALEDRPGIGPDGDRYLWPPFRAQLSTPEVEEGADQLSPSGEDDPDA